jgi:serine/threonine protein kinase
MLKSERPCVNQLRSRFRRFPPTALALLERMLCLDPTQRISASDALDHDYFWEEAGTCKPHE